MLQFEFSMSISQLQPCRKLGAKDSNEANVPDKTEHESLQGEFPFKDMANFRERMSRPTVNG